MKRRQIDIEKLCKVSAWVEDEKGIRYLKSNTSLIK